MIRRGRLLGFGCLWLGRWSVGRALLFRICAKVNVVSMVVIDWMVRRLTRQIQFPNNSPHIQQ